MSAAFFGSLRANKAASRLQPVFATVFAAGATLVCTCGAVSPALGAEAPRVGLPAPSALHGIKIDTNESALNFKRTEALLATYLSIADYLAEIARKPMTPHGRFLIVWAKGRDEYYVQCLFFDADRQIRCEGASGYYYPEIKGYVTATKGEVGNFARELRVDELGTRPIAKLIIELLARVYDLGTSASFIIEKGRSCYC